MTALRLGVLVTHPVQYFSALFRDLAVRPGVELEVLYAHAPSPREQGADFGVEFAWDIDLTSGYEHRFLSNRAQGRHDGGFRGYDTPEISGIVQRGRYDAFLVFGWHARTYWQAMRACWQSRVPVLVRGDSQLGTADAGVRGLAKRLVYPHFVGRFAACLATGTRSEAYFRHYGARAVVRSPHFVDNAWFAARADESGAARARASFGLPADGLVLLFAGKLVDRKRPVDVIEAAIRARRPMSVLIVGDGVLRVACEAAAKRARAAGVQVVFAGFLNQTAIPAAYAAADVLALPSNDRETWGLVVNEAMACGRAAVVSSAVGCAPDLVLEGQTGHVHADGDIDAMAHLFAGLADDRPRALRMGDAARALVAHYTPAAAGDGVMRAVSGAVREGASR